MNGYRFKKIIQENSQNIQTEQKNTTVVYGGLCFSAMLRESAEIKRPEAKGGKKKPLGSSRYKKAFFFPSGARRCCGKRNEAQGRERMTRNEEVEKHL